ncbi:hypothetical protein PUN28_018404 [Cardiocondyla obscurior]|uniref:Secreted protein n=1 Tax=Cardiocondyla obscurior TaxID=286306 RepID=A0AAW2EIA4_9HYME
MQVAAQASYFVRFLHCTPILSVYLCLCVCLCVCVCFPSREKSQLVSRECEWNEKRKREEWLWLSRQISQEAYCKHKKMYTILINYRINYFHFLTKNVAMKKLQII